MNAKIFHALSLRERHARSKRFTDKHRVVYEMSKQAASAGESDVFERDRAEFRRLHIASMGISELRKLVVPTSKYLSRMVQICLRSEQTAIDGASPRLIAERNAAQKIAEQLFGSKFFDDEGNLSAYGLAQRAKHLAAVKVGAA